VPNVRACFAALLVSTCVGMRVGHLARGRGVGRAGCTLSSSASPHVSFASAAVTCTHVLRFRGLPHADGAVVLCGAAAVQAKGLATRVRKQFDDLRIQVKEKTREIQEVQAELRILDKMVFADRTHDAVRMSSELDLLTDKFVLVAVGLCVGPRICLCLCVCAFSRISLPLPLYVSARPSGSILPTLSLPYTPRLRLRLLLFSVV
jgi:hypothetical protein